MVSGAFWQGGSCGAATLGNAVEDGKVLSCAGFLADRQFLENVAYVGFELGRYPERFLRCLVPVVFLLAFQNVVFDPEEREEGDEDQGGEAVGRPRQGQQYPAEHAD